MNTELPRPIDTIPEWIFERSRTVLLFPDEGKGYELWSERLPQIAKDVGFTYKISSFMEGAESGADIADLRMGEITDDCPF